jgi:parallel beta-helix repeat protein
VSAPILPKSNDRFIGTAPNRDGVTIKTTSAQVIFNADQTIGTSFRHFAITGAVNACPGFNCGATGRAISRGAELTLTDMHLYGNGQNGIGAAGEGLIVTRSEIDHNGAKVSDGVSAGIKSIHSMTVTDSYIHDNVNNGIWCDIQCGRFVVSHNTVVRNTGSGIFMEISQGPAIIERNTVKGNNQAHSPTAGGINITDSKNAIVRNNLVSNNFGFDIAAHVDPRINCGSPSPACGFLLSHVKILGNSIGQNPIQGCDTTAVECAHNR